MAAMMECGHSAQGFDAKGEPVCLACVGLRPGARTVVSAPNLEGRKAKCCSREPVASSVNLAFFRHDPSKEFDSYYCGHGGWN